MMLHLRRALVLHSRWSKPAFLSFRNPLVMESPCFPNTASGPKADLEKSGGEGLPLRSRTKYQECRNPLASTAVRDRLSSAESRCFSKAVPRCPLIPKTHLAWSSSRASWAFNAWRAVAWLSKSRKQLSLVNRQP